MHNSGTGINLRQGDRVKEEQCNELTISSHNRYCICKGQQKMMARAIKYGDSVVRVAVCNHLFSLRSYLQIMLRIS